jgi:hypothetical protein
MNIINFKSDPSKTPFSPTWNYYMFEGTILQHVDINFIRDMILLWEPKIIQQYEYINDWGTGLGKNSMTARSSNYNLLFWPEMSPLRSAIRKAHDIFVNELGIDMKEKLYIQCWANVMRVGEEIKQHQHWKTSYSYLGGHVAIQCNDTCTYYVNPFTRESYASPNEHGKITLFPNWIEHYTDTHRSNSERITIAFDIITETVYNEDIFPHKKDHWVLL